MRGMMMMTIPKCLLCIGMLLTLVPSLTAHLKTTMMRTTMRTTT